MAKPINKSGEKLMRDQESLPFHLKGVTRNEYLPGKRKVESQEVVPIQMETGNLNRPGEIFGMGNIGLPRNNSNDPPKIPEKDLPDYPVGFNPARVARKPHILQGIVGQTMSRIDYTYFQFDHNPTEPDEHYDFDTLLTKKPRQKHILPPAVDKNDPVVQQLEKYYSIMEDPINEIVRLVHETHSWIKPANKLGLEPWQIRYGYEYIGKKLAKNLESALTSLPELKQTFEHFPKNEYHLLFSIHQEGYNQATTRLSSIIRSIHQTYRDGIERLRTGRKIFLAKAKDSSER